MKNLAYMAAAIIVLAVSANAQTTNYSIRQVRDPVQFQAQLNSDMTAIAARLGATEAVTNGGALAAGKILVGNAAGVVEAQELSGNATMTTSGVVTVSGAADAFTVTASGTATATFIGADAAGAANTEYDTTGAGAITVGSADVTAITLTTDGTGTGEVVLPLASIGSAELDTENFATLTFDGGSFDIKNTTQLVFIAGSVTNVIDPDITSP